MGYYMRFLCVFLYFGSVLCGQRVLYNPDLDKKGQDTAIAAKAISSDSVTAQEIANLAIIEKQQLDTALDASLNTMRLERVRGQSVDPSERGRFDAQIASLEETRQALEDAEIDAQFPPEETGAGA